MTEYKNVNLRVDLKEITSVTVESQSDHSFSVECINTAQEEQDVQCSIEDIRYRDLSSVIEVSYLSPVLNVGGTRTAITLDNSANYTVSKTELGLPEDDKIGYSLPAGQNLTAEEEQKIKEAADARKQNVSTSPEIFIDVHANWNSKDSVLQPPSLISAKIPTSEYLTVGLMGESCVKMDVTDTVYTVILKYDATIIVSSTNENNLYELARNITSNSVAISTANNVVSFAGTVQLKAHTIITQVTNTAFIECEIQSTQPTSVPQITSGLTRYGVAIDTVTGQNILGVYYGFSNSKVNTVFNYDNIDKYAALVTSDSCFKVRMGITINLGFKKITLGFWMDASIALAVLDTFVSALNVASAALAKYQDLVNSYKTAYENMAKEMATTLTKKAVLVGKALTTEEGRAALVRAAQRYAEAQVARIKAIADYEKWFTMYNSIQEILEKVQEIMQTISALKDLTSSSGGGQNLRVLAETAKTTIETVNSGIETLIKMVDNLPDSVPLKEKIQNLIHETQKLIEMIKEIPNQLLTNPPDFTTPIKVLDRLLDLLFNCDLIKQFFKVVGCIDAVTNVYNLILEELDQTGLLKATAELEEIGAKQEKTALEKEVEELAKEVEAEIDSMSGTVKDLIPSFYGVSLLELYLNPYGTAMNLAASALGSASEGVETAKRDKIKSFLSSYLIRELDLYKISRIGTFNENNPNEKQILVNDLLGTRIYSSDGNTLLFERSDFCKHPFTDLRKIRLSTGGCDSGADPCGVGGYNCQELQYNYMLLKYRVSFDFYANHDLSQGGVVIGDFDGDGIDDIMCHYPSVTRNYDKITQDASQRNSTAISETVENNEIIYSPLKSRTSNGRFQSKEQVLTFDNNEGEPGSQSHTSAKQSHWCKDGVIKVGDFNGDGKDDLFCITPTQNYLMYSNGYTFRTGGTTYNGTINLRFDGLTSSGREFHSLASNTTTALEKLVVLSGDYDGDGYDDLLQITSNNVNIYYGDSEQGFVQNSTRTNEWISVYKSQITACYSLGQNHIIVGDVNNDGKDDITCVETDGKSANTVHSTILSQTNPTTSVSTSSISTAAIYINDVDLHSYTTDQINNARQSIVADYTTHKNTYGANGLLIAQHEIAQNYKSVSNIRLSLNCLNFTDITVLAHISYSGEYIIPATLLWKEAADTSTLVMNVDVSAKFKGASLAEVESNRVQTFTHKVEAYQGGCYKAETVASIISIDIPFNATAKMVIERSGELLQGRDLEQEAKKVITDFEIEDESIISFLVEGEMTANVLGVGFEVINHC